MVLNTQKRASSRRTSTRRSRLPTPLATGLQPSHCYWYLLDPEESGIAPAVGRRGAVCLYCVGPSPDWREGTLRSIGSKSREGDGMH
jgi:hypothetical protein